MERDKIRKTPAGKEMDALIAEKVMGWKQDSSDEGKFFGFWLTGMEDPARKKVSLDSYPFSTNIKVAWELVEKIGLVVGPEIFEPGNKQWCASLVWENRQESEYTAVAETPSLAICRAVLLIVTAE